jgi:predicted nucleic-acid-binding protein
VIAVDTNVLLRFLLNDDKKQSLMACDLLAKNHWLLLGTVLLETSWVLQSVYQADRATLSAMLDTLVNLQGGTLENSDMAKVPDWHREGMDIADAIHLALANAHQCEQLATFDVNFVKKAKKKTGCEVMVPGKL